MGRPAKPLAAHRLAGTVRLDRHANRIGELSIEDGIGKAPAFLPAEGRKEWKRLASHPQYGRALTSLDRDGFTEYCWLHARMVAEIQGLTSIRAIGEVITPEGGEGLFALSASDSQRLHSLRMQLGLTPASRSKVRIPEKPTANKWQVLKNNVATPPGA